ncbi:alcohol dehydrogenase GroES domain-containing protein [Hypoxylon sp. FL1284]|nr:alcohol dehydrogenase GroES domain-containing protein [Hypoxylon sp. FL1284]
MSSNATQLPSTYKGLLFTSASTPPTVASVPTPPLEHGTVIVRPIYTWVFNYAAETYANGNPRNYPIKFPVVGGTNGIGRVAAVAPDATSLKAGDLVAIDPFVPQRDGVHVAGPVSLGMSEAHQGVWAELVRIPLENAVPIDEAALRRRNVSLQDLAFYPQLVVAYGGFRDVGLTAGETVLVAPATGNFGGGAVHVALAMGARVIAMGRNEKILVELKALAPGRVDTVALSGSVEADVANIARFGPVDVFQDFSPPMVANKSHIRAGILSVRAGGRVSLMGAVADLEIPYALTVLRGLRIQGTLMYTRDQALEFIKLVETGALKLGAEAGLTTKGVFKLEEWDAAIELAVKEAGAGRAVQFAPNQDLL